MSEHAVHPAPDVRLCMTLRWPFWAAFVVLAATFHLAPGIDLQASALFANGRSGFALQHDPGLHALARTVYWLSRLLALVLTLALLLGWLAPARRRRAWAWLIERRRPVLYLLLVLVLGPGVLVNGVLKEHSGRARPSAIVEFGGTQRFTGAFDFSGKCPHNCAFPSGDAAVAASPVAGFFVARSRRLRRAWLAAGIASGLAVGLARMATGSHFLSDVLFAVVSTYLVAALCAAWVVRERQPLAS